MNRFAAGRGRSTGKAGIILMVLIAALALASPAGAASYFFIGPGNWSSAGSWATSTGGATGFGPPTSGDTATFDVNSSACTIDTAALASTVTLDIAFASTVSCTNSLTCDILVVNGGSLDIGTNTLTINAAGSATIDNTGTLTATSGTIDCNGTFDLNAGTFSAPSGNFFMAGNLTMIGGATFNNNSGVTVIDGPCSIWSQLDLYDLTIAAGGNCSLSQNLVIHDFTATGGSFALGSRTLGANGTVFNLSSLSSFIGTGGTLNLAGSASVTSAAFTLPAIKVGDDGVLSGSVSFNDDPVIEGDLTGGTCGGNSISFANRTVKFSGSAIDLSNFTTFDTTNSTFIFDRAASETTVTSTGQAFNNVQIASAVDGGQLLVASASTMTINGDLTFGTGTGGGGVRRLNFMGATITHKGGIFDLTNCNSINQINGTLIFDGGGPVSLTTATNSLEHIQLGSVSGCDLTLMDDTTIGGNVSVGGGGSNIFNFSNRIITLSGSAVSWDLTGITTMMATGSTLEITGDIALTPGAGTTYNNIAIGAGSGGTLTLGGMLNADGNVMARPGGTTEFYLGSNAHYFGGQIFDVAALTVFDATVTDITFDNVGTTYVNAGSHSFQTLTIATGNDVAMGSDLNAASSVAIQSGATLFMNGFNFSETDGTFSNDGTVKLIGTETIAFAGTAVMDTDSGLFHLLGSNDASQLTYTVPDFGAGNDFYDLLLDSGASNSDIFTFGNPPTIANSLTIAAGTIVSSNSHVITATLFENSGTLRLQGNEGPMGFTQDIDSGTVEYIGWISGTNDLLAIQDFGAVDYYNLVIASAAAPDDFYLNGDTNVDGNLTIASGVTLETRGNNLVVTGSFSNDGHLAMNGNELTITFGGGMDTDSGAVVYVGNTDISPENLVIKDFDIIADYYDLIIAPTADPDSITMGADINVLGSLTILAGATFETKGFSLNVTGSFYNDGALVIYGIEPLLSFGVMDTDSGIIRYVGNGDITKDFIPIRDFGDPDYYELQVKHSPPAFEKFYLNTPITAENLVIIGATLEANGQMLDIAQSFTNLGRLKLMGSEPSVTFGLGNDVANGIVEYVGDGDGISTAFTLHDFGSSDYFGLVINSSGTAPDTFEALSGVTVEGVLTILKGAISMKGFPLKVAGSFINEGELVLSGSEPSVQFDLGMDTDSGTVVYTGNLSATGETLEVFDFGVTDYYNLRIDSGADPDIMELTENLQVANGISIEVNGILSSDGWDINATGGFENQGTLVLTGGETTVNFGGTGMDTDSGIVKFAGNGNGVPELLYVKEFNAGGPDYFNLLIDSAGEPDTFTFVAGTSIEGSLAIASGCTLETNGQSVTLIGPIYNDGRLHFNGNEASIQFLSGNDTDSGVVAYTGSNSAAREKFNLFDFGGIDYFDLELRTMASPDDDYYGMTTEIVLQGNLSIFGTTLETAGRNLSVNGGLFNDGALVLQGNEAVVNFSGGMDLDSGKVVYTGIPNTTPDNITVKDFGAADYYELIISPGLEDDKFQLGNNLSVDGLSLLGATLEVQGFSLDVTGVTFENQGVLSLRGTEPSVNLAPGNDIDSGLVMYSGNGNAAPDTFPLLDFGPGADYFDLTIDSFDPGDAFEAVSGISIEGALFIKRGAVSMNSNSLWVMGTFSNDDRLVLTGAEPFVTFNSGLDTDSGTFVYKGVADAAQNTYVIPDRGAIDAYNLVIDSGAADSDIFQPSGAFQVLGGVSIEVGAVFDAAGIDISFMGGFDNEGTLRLRGFETTVSLTPGMDTDSGTVEYTGDGDLSTNLYSIRDFGTPDYYSLSFPSIGAPDFFNLISGVSVEGNLSIGVGVTFETAGNSIDVVGVLSNDGRFRMRGDESRVTFGAYDLDSGVTEYTGLTNSIADTYTIKDFGAGIDYFDLVLSPSLDDDAFNLAVSTPLYVGGSLTILAGVTFETGGSDLTVSGVVENQGALQIQGNEILTLSSGMDTDSGTVVYTGIVSAAQNAIMLHDSGATDFYNLVLKPDSGGEGDFYRIPGALNVAGSMNIDGVTFETMGFDVEVTGTFQNNGRIRAYGNEGLIALGPGGNDTDSGLFEYVGFTGGGTNPLVLKDFGVSDYYDLLLSVNGDGDFYRLGQGITIEGSLTIAGATLETMGNPIRVAGTFENQGRLRVRGDEPSISLGNGMDTDSGIFEYGGIPNASQDFILIRDFGYPSYFDLIVSDGAEPDVYRLSSSLALNGSLTIAGTTLETTGFELNVSGPFENLGLLRLTGAEPMVSFGSGMDVDSGTVEYAGTVDSIQDTYSLNDFSMGADYYDLVINTPDDLDILEMSSYLLVANNLAIKGGVLSTYGNSIEVLGNYDNQGFLWLTGTEPTVSFASGNDVDSGTTVYKGYFSSSADEMAIKDFGSPDYFNLVLDGGSDPDNFILTSKTDVAANLDVTGTTLRCGNQTVSVTATSTIGVGASVEIDNGSFEAMGPFDSSSGKVKFIGSGMLLLADAVMPFGILDAGTGTVSYGGVTQPVQGGVTYGNLELAGTGTFPLTGGATVEGNLILNSGNLDLGASDLHMGVNSGVSGSPSPSSHVIVSSTGMVKKLFPSGVIGAPTPTFPYPIGDGTYYTPLSLTFNTGTFDPGAYVMVGVTVGKHPSDPSTTEYIARHWPLVSSGVTAYTADLMAMYDPNDVVGVESNISAAVLGSTWEVFSVASAGTLTANGVTALGDVAGLATPVIISVTPSIGPGAGGNQVTISGANLGDGIDVSAVYLCGVPVTSIDSQTADSVTVTAGHAMGFYGSGDVEVFSTSFGTTVLFAGYEYNQQGMITAVIPPSGPVQGGTSVAIQGLNLCDGADVTAVTICGVPVASIDSIGVGEIVVTTAPGSAGPGDVVIESTSFGTTARVGGFAYTATYLVADNGNGSDGLTWPTAFTTIQAAIAAAAPMDTIRVGSSGMGHGSGHYIENVTIGKPLSIESESGYGTTVIEGADPNLDAVTIAADMVGFNGFRIFGATASGRAAVRADGRRNLKIDNIMAGDLIDPLMGNFHGIYLSNCVSSDVLAFNARNSADANIIVQGSSMISVSHAIAYGGTDGIRIETSSNCSVSSCTFDQGTGNGISLISTFDSMIIRNKVADYTGYGLLANASQGNTIFLNSMGGNLAGNATGMNGSSNFWNSPAKVHYDMRSGGFFSGFLGNFYGDGDHVGPGGVSVTPYAIPGDSTDSYQIVLGCADPSDYEPQAFVLSGFDFLTRGNFGGPINGMTVEPGQKKVFSTLNAPPAGLSFPAGDWEASLAFLTPPSSDPSGMTIEIGYVESQAYMAPFTPEASVNTVPDGIMTRFNLVISAPAFDVPANRFLAIRVSHGIDQNLYLLTGGGFSYLSSPLGSPEYPLLPHPAHPAPLTPDDMADTLAWNYLGRFPNPGDYEMSIDGGITWTPCASNPATVGPGIYQDTRLRVRAGMLGATRPEGLIATAWNAFTALPTLGPVPFTAHTYDAGVTVEVIADGGALFEAGVCFGTSAAPTVSGNTLEISYVGPGLYPLTIFGLNPGITYYIRSYGINGSGIAYGPEASFTTNSPPQPTPQVVSGPEDWQVAVTLTASDIDGDPLTYYVDTLPATGTLYQTPDGTTLGSPIISAPDAVTNPGGTVIFVPTADDYGHPVVSQGGATWPWFHSAFGFSVWDGEVSASSGITVEITPVPDVPQVPAASTVEDSPSPPIQILPASVDGPEVTHFKFTAISNGTLYLSDGTTSVSDGAFVTVAQAAAGLVFIPPQDSNVAGGFVVEPSMDGTTVTTGSGSASCAVYITPVGDTPVVAATASTLKDTPTNPIAITPNPVDGAEVTHFRVSNITNGSVAVSTGSTPVSEGGFITLADGASGLVFTPATGFSGSGSFSVEASQDGSTVTSQTGLATCAITIIETNSAPVVDKNITPDLTPIYDSATANSGTTVSAILASGGAGFVADGEQGTSLGIAVTGVEASIGSWQFSPDGTTWTPVGTPRVQGALLLPGSWRLRFVPVPAPERTLYSSSVTFKAWDMVTGTAGQAGVDTSFFNSGGSASFSVDVATAYVAVHPKKFSVSISPAQIAENAAAPASGTVSIPLPELSDLTVKLSSGSLDQATVTAQIVIPAGSTSAVFQVTPVNDKLADGPAGVEISAAATGWVSGKASISIIDDDAAAIAVSMATTFSEKSGTQSGSVNLLSSSSSAVTVSLTSSNPLRVVVPQSVVVPAGTLTVPFTATIADNGAIDGDEEIVISGSALGWTTGTLTVKVTDDEKKTVALTVTKVLREGLGTIAGAGSVLIGGTLPSDLTVTLTSSVLEELTVPAEVVVKAGQTSASFDITVIDDALEDGQTLVTITPAATGFTATALSVSVQDDDATSQLVISAPIRLNEGIGLVVGQCQVTRYGNTDSALAVTLSSNLTSILTVPASITIPAGEASVSFDITVLDDETVGTSKAVIIVASSAGWLSGTTVITVLEDDQLKVNLTLAAKLMAGAGEVSAAGTVSIPGKLADPLAVTLTSLDPEYLTVPASLEIPAGSLSAVFPVTVLVPASTQGAHTVRVKAESPGFSATVAETVVFEPPKAELETVVLPVGKTGVSLTVYIDPNVRTETISQAARYDTVSITLDPALFTFSPIGSGEGFANAVARDLSGGDLLLSIAGVPQVALDTTTNTLTLKLANPAGLSDSPYLRPMVVSFSGVTASNPILDANGTAMGAVTVNLVDTAASMQQMVLAGDGDGGNGILTGTLTYLLRENILPAVSVSYAEAVPNRLILKPGIENEVRFAVHVRIPAIEANWSPAKVSGTGINDLLLKFPVEMTVSSIKVKTSNDGGQPGTTPPALTELVQGTDYFESTEPSVAGSRVFRFVNSLAVAETGADAVALFEVTASMPGTGTSFRVPSLLRHVSVSGSSEVPGPVTYVTSGDADGIAANSNSNIIFLSMESKRPEISAFTARDFFMGTPGAIETETRIVSKARLSIEARDSDSVFGLWLFWSTAELTGTEALAEISTPAGRLRGINRTPFVDARRSEVPKLLEIDWNVVGLYENTEVFPAGSLLESVPIFVYAFAYDGTRPTEAELPTLMVRGTTRIIVVKPDPEDKAPEFAFTSLSIAEVNADSEGPLKFKLSDDRQGLVKILFYYAPASGDTKRAKACKDSSGGHLAGSLQPFVGTLADSRVYQVNWDTALVQSGSYHILARVTDGGHAVAEFWSKYPVRLSHAYDDIAPTFEWILPGSEGTLTPVTDSAPWSFRVLDGDGDTLSVTLFVSPVMAEGDEMVQLSPPETISGTTEFVSRQGTLDVSGFLGGAYYLMARVEQPLKAVPPVSIWTPVPILVDRAAGIGNLAIGNPYPDPATPGKAAVAVSFTTTQSSIPEVRYGLSGVLDKTETGIEGFDHAIVLSGLDPGKEYRLSVHASTASGDEFSLDNGGRNYALKIPALAAQAHEPRWIRGKISPEEGVVVRLYVVRNPGTSEQVSRRFVIHPDATGAWFVDIGGAIEAGGKAEALAPAETDFVRAEIVTRGGKNAFIDNVPLTGISAALTVGLAIAPEALGGTGQGISVSQSAYAFSLALPKGFSLVAVPNQPVTPMTSKGFIELAGANCVAIYAFSSITSSYSMLARVGDGFFGSDFPISLSDGFFVKMTEAATIEIMVKKLEAPKTHAVQRGFNLIGLPFSPNFPADGRTGLTAFGLLRSLGTDGIAVYAFDNGTFRMVAKIGYDQQGEPIFHPSDGDFDIVTGMGVFVKTLERSSFRGEGE